MTTSERIKQLREEKGWSQRCLAKRTGLANSTISRIESGQDDWKFFTLERIAIALDVDAVTLIYSEVNYVAVVRCKNCVHCNTKISNGGWCNMFSLDFENRELTVEHFCGKGQRAGDESCG
jgi:transcriptional regulator with XRE-family HTH domain